MSKQHFLCHNILSKCSDFIFHKTVFVDVIMLIINFYELLLKIKERAPKVPSMYRVE